MREKYYCECLFSFQNQLECKSELAEAFGFAFVCRVSKLCEIVFEFQNYAKLYLQTWIIKIFCDLIACSHFFSF